MDIKKLFWLAVFLVCAGLVLMLRWEALLLRLPNILETVVFCGFLGAVYGLYLSLKKRFEKKKGGPEGPNA